MFWSIALDDPMKSSDEDPPKISPFIYNLNIEQAKDVINIYLFLL